VIAALKGSIMETYIVFESHGTIQVLSPEEPVDESVTSNNHWTDARSSNHAVLKAFAEGFELKNPAEYRGLEFFPKDTGICYAFSEEPRTPLRGRKIEIKRAASLT
jgi:hypothetical protein